MTENETCNVEEVSEETSEEVEEEAQVMGFGEETDAVESE